MQLDRFSRQLRLGFDSIRVRSGSALKSAAEDEPALAGLTLDDITKLSRDPRKPLADQDVLWAAVLRCYRRESASTWAAVLLEMLAPEMVDLAGWISAVTPAADPSDIQQQLVLEALHAAKRVRAVPGSRFVKLRLSREIRRKMRRRLWRRPRFSVASFEALTDEDPGSLPMIDDESAWELAEVRASNVRKRDLSLVSLELRGDKLEDMARQMGCTPNALQCRVRRARARIQRQLAA